MFMRELMFSREKSGWLRAPSSPSSFSISFLKELRFAMTPSNWVWMAELASCWDVNFAWSLLINSWSWVIEVLCTCKVDFVSFALLIQEFSLTLNSWSEDKEAWTNGPTFFKSLNAVTRIFNQSTLTLRPLASLNVERKSSRGRARQSSLPFNYNWNIIDPICFKIKPLSDKVHLLVSFIVLDIWRAVENKLLSNQEKSMRPMDKILSGYFHSLGLWK